MPTYESPRGLPRSVIIYRISSLNTQQTIYQTLQGIGETSQTKIKSMKNKFFLLIQSITVLALLFFSLNMLFDFITFESSKVNPISNAVLCFTLLLLHLKKKKSRI